MYPEKTIDKIALATWPDDPIQFTHEHTPIPMDQLESLPLGIDRGDTRDGTFELLRPTSANLRKMRNAMASFKAGKKRPGAKIAGEVAMLCSALGGREVSAKVGERAVQFARLPLGDAWTLVHHLQAARGGGAYVLDAINCPHCGHEFTPRLDLTKRTVNCYRSGVVLGELPDGSPDDAEAPITDYGQPLAKDDQPHAAVALQYPVTFPIAGGRESTKLVLSVPSWMSSVYEAPANEWEDDAARALNERTVAAAIIGDEEGPFSSPLSLSGYYQGDTMAPDVDRMIVALMALAGGPPPIIEVTCPNTAGQCEAVLGFPVGWDNADFFDLT